LVPATGVAPILATLSTSCICYWVVGAAGNAPTLGTHLV
jgi:hypothetical protein